MKPLTMLLGSLLLVAIVTFIIILIWPPSTEEPVQTVGNETEVLPPPKDVITIDFFSSNTKENWITVVVEQFNQEQHTIASGESISVQVEHVTSGGSKEDILAEKIQPTVWSPGDISWVDVANQEWRRLRQRPLVSGECPSTIQAPSGFAMWRPMAEALGWPDKPISWDDIVALSADPNGWASLGRPDRGKFTFGHAHPFHSNVGLQMMTALAYSTVGSTSGLTPEQVYSDDVVDAFANVEQNTYHYGIQSRNLINLMVKNGPAYLHAVTTSEAETLKTNHERGDQLRFPLVFIFPAGGTFWSEHPFCILDTEWVSDQQVEAAEVFREYLLDPDQQALAIENFLRPVDRSIPLECPICIKDGTDPRVTREAVPALESPSAETAEAVIDIFFQTKKKATVVLLIDTSGSMRGDKIRKAAEGASDFIERLDTNDKVYAIGFGGTAPYPLGDGGRKGDIGEELMDIVNELFANGGTPLYDAVCAATERAAELKAEDEANGERRLYGVVLLSDGKDSSSTRSQTQMFRCLPTGEITGVKIFTIAYGDDADADLMKGIANQTNGRWFAATRENIDKIYRAISAEQ